MIFRPLVDRRLAEQTLNSIFPREAFDSVLSSPLAGAAVAAMIYVGAVVDDDQDPPEPANVWARPSTVLQMSDDAFAMGSDQERLWWSVAESRSAKAIAALLEAAGVVHRAWYATNTRETLRDETWPKWLRHGAVRLKQDVLTNSSRPRWALTASFANLFDPALSGGLLEEAIDAWRAAHLEPGDLLRIYRANQLAKASHQVEVHLPGGGVRLLEPGNASLILKGVIEDWSPARLAEPFVVAISEPGAKMWSQEGEVLAAAGITINVSTVLPDAIIVDIGAKPPVFWIVEAVATDGEISEARKEDLLRWAVDTYIDPDRCEFVSAFLSRNHPAARRRLKDLAVGTFAWFLDEPGRELAWYDLDRQGSRRT